MGQKKALVTGISGQDGAYLADFLLKKNYNVVGLDLDVRSDRLWRLKYFGIENKIKIFQLDIKDGEAISNFIAENDLDEIYNLAGISSVGQSWEKPIETLLINGASVLFFLEAIKEKKSEIKFFQASSANIYGDTRNDKIINEESPYKPVDPYGVAKLAAHCSVANYRQYHGLFCTNGILFNHTSPLHSDFFVFKKIIKGAVQISRGENSIIELGNANVRLDWGYAKDYVEAMWLMLQQDKPDDFVICFQQQHSLEELLQAVFQKLGIDNWDKYVKINKELMRKKDIFQPPASNKKIKQKLNWQPKTDFDGLIKIMIDYEMEKNY